VTGEGLPWRGPGPGSPELPLPPGRMPLRQGGVWRKRWRYAGFFGDEMLGCAARVEVGPLGQTFWALWDRGGEWMLERTKVRLPGRRGEVWTEGDGDILVGRQGGGEASTERDGELLAHIARNSPQDPVAVGSLAAEEGSVVRIESRHRQVARVSAALRFGSGRWAEAVCPAGEDAYVWTRKRAGVPVVADVRLGEGRRRFEALGVEDESAGYHPRHTVWSWSAGVGRTADGRAVAWNLVAGINDPPERSERAIWVDGEPFEPGPCEFHGLEGISFADGSALDFAPECERRKAQNLLVVRYAYRQPFGSFSGTLPGGLELERGLGVMEHHDATW
jgi:hypothetical protein